ncbi:MAG: PD-(D/E)XK nuclease family protein [Acidobacteria bacterium]|nr:PD-(D/E)XK nuclease family protein [Acidobacteriota bacterium]
MPRDGTADERAPALWIVRGARAAEAVLLREVLALATAAEADPRLLGRPVLVVVPSGSLREHVAAALVRARARALAGVEVLTLYRLAARLLEAAGEPAAGSDRLLPILARRFGRQEPLLRAALDPMRDGWRVLAATLRDFLDAGFEPPHAEGCLDALRELGEGAEIERAAAIVRVAAAVAATVALPGLGRRADVVRRAALLLAERGGELLGARAVLVHGFAETTAVAGDLLVALVRHAGARVVLDEPPDPADPGRDEPHVFTARVRERLGAGATHGPVGAAPDRPDELALVRAAGPSAEAREVARRVRTLLDGGATPESIGVVARDLAALESPIARHFGRLGIPFAVRGGPGSAGAAVRRLRALGELLERGTETTADSFLSAWHGLDGAVEVEGRVGLRASGAVRLGEVAGLDAAALLGGRSGLPLPLVKGAATDDDETAAPPRHRVLRAGTLELVVATARDVCGRLATAPGRAPLAVPLEWLRGLLAGGLGWSREDPGAVAAEEALAGLEAEVPAELVVERDEFALLAADALAGAGAVDTGGAGAGVQVLSVMEARGRTFDHLFVVSLNRDVFPRVLHEDPLLADRLRVHLAQRTGVLSDLPVKRRGGDEERYLFAQLVAASPRVTLSWRVSDDDGKPCPASPLAERVRLALGAGEVDLAGDPWSADSGDELRPAHEHAVLAGLHSSRRRFSGTLAAALAAGGLGRDEAVLVAGCHTRVLDELDPDRRVPEGRRRAAALGPWFGFVGPVRSPSDRRHGDLYVTHLERVAACPWQTFLRRLLRLEPPPDPRASLPGIDPPLVGQLVHRVLQRVCGGKTDARAELTEVMARVPHRPPWPGPGRLSELLREEADTLVREAGLSPAGLAALLAARAAVALEVARSVDWAATPPDVLGAEVVGRVVVGGRAVSFVADRVDALGEGVRLTDYKTGRSHSTNKTPAARERDLRREVAAGRRLQAAAYALAVADRPAEGRYVYLRPDEEPEHRVACLSNADAESADAFATAATAVFAAWDLGAFLPRLVGPEGRKEYQGCQWCEVAPACVRHDSGARARLNAWLADAEAAKKEGAAVAAARRVWMLAAKPTGDGGRES